MNLVTSVTTYADDNLVISVTNLLHVTTIYLFSTEETESK